MTNFDQQMDTILSGLTVDQQSRVTEAAVIMLGEDLTDERYLETVEFLSKLPLV